MCAAPRQMTAHTLDGIKGWPNNLHAVDFAAKLSPNVTIDPVFAGRCVHLNGAGEYEMGLPDIDKAGHMPIFIFQNSDDPDVKNDGGITGSESDEPGGFTLEIVGNLTNMIGEIKQAYEQKLAAAGQGVPSGANGSVPLQEKRASFQNDDLMAGGAVGSRPGLGEKRASGEAYIDSLGIRDKVEAIRSQAK